MRIMTSNIWGDYFGNAVFPRDEQLWQVYRQYAPDILGLQEATDGWHDSDLFAHLRQAYTFIGDRGNYVPLAVSRRYPVVASGYEPLLNTPDVSKGITWAVFTTPDGPAAVCNTHFWWKVGEQHDAIRLQNAQQLVSRMQQLHRTYACPVFAVGDMNSERTAAIFSLYEQQGLFHLFDVAVQRRDVSSHHGNPEKGEDGLYHGCPTDRPHTHSIDHMLVMGQVTVTTYEVVEDQPALDASDHSPVYADVMI